MPQYSNYTSTVLVLQISETINNLPKVRGDSQSFQTADVQCRMTNDGPEQ